MKKLIPLFVLFSSFSTLFGQYPLAKDQTQINAGVGFSNWGLPVYVGFDHGIHKDVSLGVEASFRGYRERWHDDHYRHSIIGIAANVNYHFNYLFEIPADEWDIYGGANIGFLFWSSPHNYGGGHASGLGLGIQLGGRYYFNERAAVNLEVGGGNAFNGGKFGVTIKI